MTKREMVTYLSNYFYWPTESDKEMAIDTICDTCTEEEVTKAYQAVRDEMDDYMAVEIPAYYFQPLYKKAMGK